MAHYIDSNYEVKNVLLALRNTYGSHLAAELQHHLLDVIREFRITTRIGYFMASSASNNDVALRLLQNELAIKPLKQRLRCACYIINLVCIAVLYGVDADCVDEALEEDNISIRVRVTAYNQDIVGSRAKLNVTMLC